MEYNQTEETFAEIFKECEALFFDKFKDYGVSWAVMRWESLCDQIWIKLKRIRTLEDLRDNALVPEGRGDEYIGVVNYAVIGMIFLCHGDELPPNKSIVERGEIPEIAEDTVRAWYDGIIKRLQELLTRKNHDYGEAWQQMSLQSITDLMLVRLLRVKRIVKNDGKALVSEGLDAQLGDLINYAIFALMKLRKYSHSLEREEIAGACRFCGRDPERVLHEGKDFYVMLSLGPIREGHSLIIADKHIACQGDMEEGALREYLELQEEICRIFRDVYAAKSTIFFEHGNIGSSITEITGDSHFHLHCVPNSRERSLKTEVERDLGLKPNVYEDASAFWRDYNENHKDEPYLYIQESGPVSVFYMNGREVESQYLRKAMFRLDGADSKLTDWLEYPNWEVILDAKDNLAMRLLSADRL